MMNQDQPSDVHGYSLLTIIVNRGKGSKVMQFARSLGAKGISCLLGKGTVQNSILQMMEMNDVNKEIVLIVVPSAGEKHILQELNNKFQFEKQNHGIAFAMPLAGILCLKSDTTFKHKNLDLSARMQNEHTVVFLVVDKGKAETVIEISQNAGYYGGTIIKARGAASSLNLVLDMIVEPEKEAVLMLTETKRVDQLARLLHDQLHLAEANTGILVKLGVSSTMGLFRSETE